LTMTPRPVQYDGASRARKGSRYSPKRTKWHVRVNTLLTLEYSQEK